MGDMILGAESLHPYARFWLDVADKVVKFLAVLVGAGWAWMNYKRGRTYKLRLEPAVSGTFLHRSDNNYLLVTCRIRNVGLSVYTIEQKGSGCELIGMTPAGRNRLNTLAVFLDHKWIEPGEQIDEQLLVSIPDNKDIIAIRLNLRIVSEGIAWNSSSVLPIPDSLLITSTKTSP